VVTNAGCSGKYIGVMDLDIKDHKVIGYHYKMLPIITNLIKPDAEVVSYIDKMRQTKYDKNVVEARSSTMINQYLIPSTHKITTTIKGLFSGAKFFSQN
jgi:sulfur-oxidizing protein SoxB